MLNIEKYKDEIMNALDASIACGVHRLKGHNECAGIMCIDCNRDALKWILEECKEPILDNTERNYLSAVIRPFRNRVENISKCDGGTWATDEQFICIQVKREKNSDFISLPWFKADTMYRGMELDKNYSLKELGL